jgi:SAM-dependent methyltransferase
MITDQKTMVEYYARRAEEYERIYRKPERQTDLRKIEKFLSTAFAGTRLLEIACGTGYWTQFIARSAREVFATDFNAEVLDIAKQKDYGSCKVELLQSDAYSLGNVPPDFNAGFHGFWWSHVPNQKIDNFLQTFHSKFQPGADVVMIDNAYVEGSSIPISRMDSEGNTYQIRKLQDGSEHEVLKNFPSDTALQESLKPFGKDVRVTFLQYYWIVEYAVRKNAKL